MSDVLKRFDESCVLVAATRYYAGRMTASVHTFCCQLAAAWPDLNPQVRSIIRRDLEDDFERDDYAREKGDEFKPLGHDCDRDSWEIVRAAWRRLEAIE